MPGVPELIVILLIVVVLFGASRLPQLGRGVGEGIANLRRGLKSGEDEPKAPKASLGEEGSPADSAGSNRA